MKKKDLLVVLIMLVFFAISFLTNILGALNQKVSVSFTLTETLAGLLPFAFFIAYGVMSIPFGSLVEKYGEKRIMILAFLMAFAASLVFAVFPVFDVFIVSLFTIGAGMAALQVVINPLLRVSGGEANYAFYSVLGQLVFGLASFISPQMYTYFVVNIDERNLDKPLIDLMSQLVPENMSWVSVYWAFAVIAILMGGIIFFVNFPKVELQEDEKVGSKDSFLELIKNKYVILYFLGIFMYVGSEQGISYWLSKFLNIYHNIDPDLEGADAVSYFWGLMTVGGILGLVLMKLFDSKQILRWFTVLAVICVAAGLFGNVNIALWALPVSGFFLSVMYPTIVSLGLNSVAKHHGSFAGILMTGIAGGAVVQIVIGAVSDFSSLRVGMMLIFLTLGYILSISFWAKPLVNNKTVSLRELFTRKI
ncbi:sugar MFS transporter [Maribellus maritimus]|uniref:sugar MFS transporter n=1 Tax=Maribellus maritimus TaxID=2870838 RepID=UPI001EEC2CA5|nr:sugar MFS transporter [Maribellus maritimus]MCG6186329.1 sugar MFS transporter [Maribellus maritimus]